MTDLETRAEPRFPITENYTAVDTAPFAGPNATALRAAVDRVYVAFAHAELARPVIGCPHCFTESDLAYVQNTPLQDFTHGDLSVISFKLGTTLGKPTDLAFFLPKLLEALAEGADFTSVEVLNEKIIAAMPGWMPEQRTAVIECLNLLELANNKHAD